MESRASYLFGWSRRDLRHFLGLFLVAVVAVIFLWQVQAILPPFLIAFALAALLDPTLRYWEARGRSRVRTILALYALTLCGLGLIAYQVIPAATAQVEEISSNLSNYNTNLQQSANAFMLRHKTQLRWVGIRQKNVSELMNARSGPVQTSIAAALGGMSGLIQGLFSKILWLIIIPVAGFFLMRDYPCIRARMILMFPDVYHDRVDALSREIVDVFSAYIRGLTKICLIYGLTDFVLFSLLGVRYALFLGILAGLFYAVPYVGQVVTATSAGAVAFLMESHAVALFFRVPGHSLSYALLIVGSVIVANNLFDQIIYPRVVGGSVGLHPVISIFALMSGATLFGVWGMLLATPVAASIQIILSCFFPKMTQAPPAHLLDPLPARTRQ